MSRKDRIEKELEHLREKYKGYFLILMAILTGEASIIYAVVAGDKPIYVLLLAVFGLLALSGIAYKLSKTDNEIYEYLDELERI